MSMGQMADAPFAFPGPSIQPRHLRIQAGFVQEHQAIHIPCHLLFPPIYPGRPNVFTGLFGGNEPFLYRASPAA